MLDHFKSHFDTERGDGYLYKSKDHVLYARRSMSIINDTLSGKSLGRSGNFCWSQFLFLSQIVTVCVCVLVQHQQRMSNIFDRVSRNPGEPFRVRTRSDKTRNRCVEKSALCKQTKRRLPRHWRPSIFPIQTRFGICPSPLDNSIQTIRNAQTTGRKARRNFAIWVTCEMLSNSNLMSLLNLIRPWRRQGRSFRP